MTAERPDNDLAEIAARLAAIASGPSEQVPSELAGPVAALASSLATLARALEAPADDAATRTALADDVDRVRAGTAEAMRAATAVFSRAAPAFEARLRDVPLSGLDGALELVAAWLRAPTPEHTAAVERLVTALRALPGIEEALWHDRAREARREAELDAEVQKSLDEIAADMPKFEL
jgi:hypothetical protein